MITHPKPLHRTLLLAAVLTGFVLERLDGQDAPAAQPSASEDQTILLSPFEVRTERDIGFVAASSLAGGRLAGDLKDTPAAYSVLTRDFIDALQLTDLASMSQWMPGASWTADNGTRLTFGNEQQQVTYRGKTTNTVQRNFFPFDYNFDAYNVERLDLARGANAILFGNGAFGGSPNSVTKRAITGRDFTNLQFTEASWNNNRATLDANLALGAKAALRLNLMGQERNGWQDDDYERKHAATLAATMLLTKTTELRAEAEYGERAANVVVAKIDDRFSGWNGSSTFTSRLTSLPSNSNAIGVSRNSTNYPVFTIDGPSGTLINYGQMAITQGGDNNSAVPVGGQLVVGPSANVANQPILFAQDLPAGRFAQAIAGSDFRIPRRSFTTSPTAPMRRDRFRDVTLGVTQSVGEHLFMDLSGNYLSTYYNGNFLSNRGIAHAYININRNLPTGAPDPDFLQPYSEGNSAINVIKLQASNLRGSASYVFGRTPFGDFKFDLLGGLSQQRTDSRFYTYALAANADSRYWPTEQPVVFRYYWDEPSRPFVAPSSWNYVNPITGVTQKVNAGYYLNNMSNTVAIGRQNFDYGLASFTGKFWKDRIDVVGAVRRDYYFASSQQMVSLKDNPTGWDGVTEYFKPAAPKDWLSLSYVPKDSTGKPTGVAAPAAIRPRDSNGFALPQYANDRFQDDYSPPNVRGYSTTRTTGAVVHANSAISGFVNYGQTFDLPPIGSVSISNSLLPATSSKGWDYGLRFELLDGRVVATVLRYTGSSITLGQTTGTASQTRLDQDINRVVTARVEGDNTSGDSNGLGFPQVPSKYYDSTHTDYSGYELDMVANLTRSWRLLCNASIPRAYGNDIFPQTQAYLAANDTTLRKILSQAGVLIDSNNVASVDQSVPVSKQSPDASNAATAWNDLQNRLATIKGGSQPSQQITLVVANLFADYTFRTGSLRGLRIGGGINYRGSQIIGFRGGQTIRDPNNPSNSIPDPSVTALTPVFRDPYYTGIAVLGYSHSLGKKITAVLTLKVDNLFNYRRPIYYDTTLRPPSGDLTNPARIAVPDDYGYIPPRSYTFSTTFEF